MAGYLNEAVTNPRLNFFLEDHHRKKLDFFDKRNT